MPPLKTISNISTFLLQHLGREQLICTGMRISHHFKSHDEVMSRIYPLCSQRRQLTERYCYIHSGNKIDILRKRTECNDSAEFHQQMSASWNHRQNQHHGIPGRQPSILQRCYLQGNGKSTNPCWHHPSKPGQQTIRVALKMTHLFRVDTLTRPPSTPNIWIPGTVVCAQALIQWFLA